MAKYSTDSRGDSSDNDTFGEDTVQISIGINEWVKEALKEIVQQSDIAAKDTVSQSLEYAVIEWNRTLEQQSEFEMPGEHVYDKDFRCLECKSANRFLFRKSKSDTDERSILCLNCNNKMSREEVTRLARAAEIQEMSAYTLSHEGRQLKREYEGDYLTPMRFECQRCNERDLILPNPTKIKELICPRCGNKGKTLNQLKGPAVSNFVKHGPDKYHTTNRNESVGRNISQGEYDHLEKTYRDGYEN